MSVLAKILQNAFFGSFIAGLCFVIGVVVTGHLYGNSHENWGGLAWMLTLFIGAEIALGGGAVIGGIAGWVNHAGVGMAVGLGLAILGVLILWFLEGESLFEEESNVLLLSLIAGWTMSGATPTFTRKKASALEANLDIDGGTTTKGG